MDGRKAARLSLHPEVLMKNGRKVFVVLCYEEFMGIQERLDDAQDLTDLRRAVLDDKGEAGLTLSEMKRRLGIGGRTGRKSGRARSVESS